MKRAKLDLNRFNEADRQLIAAADQFAAAAHAGQRRKSGDDFITHPRSVAATLHDWGMDAETLAAALLHDVVEDTGTKPAEIEQQFGLPVARLVDAVTNLGQIDFIPGDGSSVRQQASYENLRKLLLAMSQDLRVITIKLADRLHNLRTLHYLPAADQVRVGQESLEIYAPLADRLGMGELKAEIEDLAFGHALPDEYRRVKELVARELTKADRYIKKLRRFVAARLKEAGIEVVSIEGRPKHYYSIYKKLNKVDQDISKIYDLVALRITVPQESDCYQVMGLLHQYFKPLIYRIKDYIAVPKPNGYRSLHTTVFAQEGRVTEIQIRTPQMHEEAERGLAAHFFYDAQKSDKGYRRRAARTVPGKLQWVNQLSELQHSSPDELAEVLQVDLFRGRIFVFSPKGDLFDLPEGSTPVDFAFAVHSDVGLRTQGAKVNGRIVPLDTALENRDVVEILTRKQPAPSQGWLGMVKTAQARGRIRAWFRAQGRAAHEASGRAAVERELQSQGVKRLEELKPAQLKQLLEQFHYKDLEGLLAAVGEGTVTPPQISRRLFPPASEAAAKPVRAATEAKVKFAAGDLPYSIAACCKPHYPQAIMGYVTRGSGVTVHTAACGNLPKEADRLLACKWL